MPTEPGQSVDKEQVVNEVTTIRHQNAQSLTKLRELFDKAETEKNNRDAENKEVKQIANQIETIRKQITETDTILKPLEAELDKTDASSSPDRIKAEIQALEYSLHVNYSTQREKTISRKMTDLSKKLKSLAKLEPKFQERRSLRAALRELRKQLSEKVKELKSHAAKSESHHQAMLLLFKQAEELQTHLPEAFSKLDEKRNTLKQLTAVEREDEQIRRKQYQQEEKQRQQKEQQHNAEAKQKIVQQMQSVKKKALEILVRFKQGEPISLEELQTLQLAGIEI